MREIREYGEELEQENLKQPKVSRLTVGEVDEIIHSANEEMFPKGVYELHFKENISLKEIAEKLGVSIHNVYRCFRENNWTPHGSTIRKELDEQTIKLLYNEKGLSQQEIADELDLSLSTVYRRFKQYNISPKRIATRDEVDVQEIR